MYYVAIFVSVDYGKGIFSNATLFMLHKIRSYIRIPTAVRRQYCGSTAAVPRQYSENTFIRLLVQFFHNFDESHIDLSMKYMIREIDKIVNKLIQYDSYTSLNQ